MAYPFVAAGRPLVPSCAAAHLTHAGSAPTHLALAPLIPPASFKQDQHPPQLPGANSTTARAFFFPSFGAETNTSAILPYFVPSRDFRSSASGGGAGTTSRIVRSSGPIGGGAAVGIGAGGGLLAVARSAAACALRSSSSRLPASRISSSFAFSRIASCAAVRALFASSSRRSRS